MTVSVVPLDPHPASPRVRDRRMAVDKLNFIEKHVDMMLGIAKAEEDKDMYEHGYINAMSEVKMILDMLKGKPDTDDQAPL